MVPAVTGTSPMISQAGDQVDHRRDDGEEDLHEGEEPLPAHLLPHLQAHLVVVLRAVAADLGALLVEALGQQDAGNRQRLLRDRGHVAERLLGLGRDFGAHLPDPALRDDQDRHEDDGDHGQLPGQQQHRHERGDHGHGVAEHAGDGVREHPGDPADVVLQPGLDDAGLGVGEEGQFHPLQVTEQLDPQRAHDLVAHGRGQPGLPHPEGRGGHVDEHHQCDDLDQHRDIRPTGRREQAEIERRLGQQRRQYRQSGADDHEDGGEDERAAVRREQPTDAVQQVRDPGGGRIECALRIRIAATHPAHPAAAHPTHDFIIQEGVRQAVGMGRTGMERGRYFVEPASRAETN